jgi:hypothetical protein
MKEEKTRGKKKKEYNICQLEFESSVANHANENKIIESVLSIFKTTKVGFINPLHE